MPHLRAPCVVSDRRPHSRAAVTRGPMGPPLPVSCPPLRDPSCPHSESSVMATLSAAGRGGRCLSSAGNWDWAWTLLGHGALMGVALAWWHWLLRFSVLGPVPLSQFLTHSKDACVRLCVFSHVGGGAVPPVPRPHADVHAPLRPSLCPAVCPGPRAEPQARLGGAGSQPSGLAAACAPWGLPLPVELTSAHVPARPRQPCWVLHRRCCAH